MLVLVLTPKWSREKLDEVVSLPISHHCVLYSLSRVQYNILTVAIVISVLWSSYNTSLALLVLKYLLTGTKLPNTDVEGTVKASPERGRLLVSAPLRILWLRCMTLDLSSSVLST